jgi:hypothetical protein
MIESGFTADSTIKLLDNVVTNDKSESNALRVHSSGVLQLSKEAEKLDPVLSFNAYSSVLDLDDQLISGRMSPGYGLDSMFFVELLLL